MDHAAAEERQGCCVSSMVMRFFWRYGDAAGPSAGRAGDHAADGVDLEALVREGRVLRVPLESLAEVLPAPARSRPRHREARPTSRSWVEDRSKSTR